MCQSRSPLCDPCSCLGTPKDHDPRFILHSPPATLSQPSFSPRQVAAPSHHFMNLLLFWSQGSGAKNSDPAERAVQALEGFHGKQSVTLEPAMACVATALPGVSYILTA